MSATRVDRETVFTHQGPVTQKHSTAKVLILGSGALKVGDLHRNSFVCPVGMQVERLVARAHAAIADEIISAVAGLPGGSGAWELRPYTAVTQTSFAPSMQ